MQKLRKYQLKLNLKITDFFAQYYSCNECTTAVPSHLGLAHILLGETNPFPELVVIFLDYSLRTTLGIFSILLSICYMSIHFFFNIGTGSTLTLANDANGQIMQGSISEVANVSSGITQVKILISNYPNFGEAMTVEARLTGIETSKICAQSVFNFEQHNANSEKRIYYSMCTDGFLFILERYFGSMGYIGKTNNHC